MAVSTAPAKVCVNQIVTKDGKPLPATLTSNLWVGRAGVFSMPTEGNAIKFFTTGEDYFADLISACDAAKSEVYILGWQVNWDALLAPRVRLYDLLLRTAKRGVRIHVMPWNDTNPVQTYDDQTKAVLESINQHPDVKAKDRVQVLLSKSQATSNNSYFSHHQKQVIVDREIAFIGGIDLAYGRYDDASYDLQADKHGRQALNRYNGCVVPVGRLDWRQDQLADPDLLTGALDKTRTSAISNQSDSDRTKATVNQGGWQVPYGNAGIINLAADMAGGIPSAERNQPSLLTLDPTKQPRMPWQDIHSRIDGPAVSYLLANFVNRWNACGGTRLHAAPKPAAFSKQGKAQIQVLRSAPAGMVKAERAALADKAGVTQPSGTEDDIHRAMVQLIDKASHFIYIENQFFVSAFGRIGGPTGELSPAAQFIDAYGGSSQNRTAKYVVGAADPGSHIKLERNGLKPKVVLDDAALHKPPTNKVCEALIKRITRSILDAKSPNFHVYITLPVHSEGMLSNATIAVQVYWTMQTLVFGSKSLLNGIRRAIKVRELMDKDQAKGGACRDHNHVLDDADNNEFESVPVEACFKYVTLLNLRNWAKLGRGKDERYVTEQVYVHSKLMIVDDLYALFGSANINDRSLLGERDSEIAVLVMDGENSRADINGKGSQRPVRKFAHELRMEVWKKLFGIAGKVRPASHLLSAIEAPGSPDSWKRIQEQAQKNAAAYEAVFPFVPRNWTGALDDDGNPVAGSILATWDPLAPPPPGVGWKRGNLTTPLPFQHEFWSSPRFSSNKADMLSSVVGFIVTLPIHWTAKENIKFEFPSALVAGAGDFDDAGDAAGLVATNEAAFQNAGESQRKDA
jgi:phospholipase D1/2